MNEYTVVLFDDEELILESLKTLLDWKSLGCQITGTARDGESGRKLLERLRPDIVITDVKMPGITGLEIAEYCAQYLPETKIIIVSAYDDFSYVQCAMLSKAVNYILKPIDREKMEETVKKAVMELKKNEKTEEELYNAKTYATSSLLFNLARYGTVGSKDGDINWISEQVKTDSVVVMANFYNTDISIESAFAEAQISIDQTLRSKGYNPIFGSADEKIIFVCPIKKNVDRRTGRKRIIEILEEYVNNQHSLGQVIFGVSEVYCTDEQLQNCYKACRKMIKTGFFASDGKVITEQRDGEKETVSLNMQELIFAVENGKVEDADFILKRWKEEIASTGDEQFALAKIRELSRTATLCAAKFEMNTENLWKHFYENENYDARYECVVKGIKQICEYIDKKGNTVNKVCLYVEQNYGNTELSLEMAAEYMQLNSSYLSRIFKKEMGENFSEYLTRIRMEQAQKLLRETNMKVYQIAEKTGYTDEHYFSQVFKRKCGIVPAKYRAKYKKSKILPL